MQMEYSYITADDARNALIATFDDAKLACEQYAEKAAAKGHLFEAHEWSHCAALYRRSLSHLAGSNPLEQLERTLRRDIRLGVSDIFNQPHTNRTRHTGREIANVVGYARRFLHE